MAPARVPVAAVQAAVALAARRRAASEDPVGLAVKVGPADPVDRPRDSRVGPVDLVEVLADLADLADLTITAVPVGPADQAGLVTMVPVGLAVPADPVAPADPVVPVITAASVDPTVLAVGPATTAVPADRSGDLLLLGRKGAASTRVGSIISRSTTTATGCSRSTTRTTTTGDSGSSGSGSRCDGLIDT